MTTTSTSNGAARRVVPVPAQGVGDGNQFREPAGTGRNRLPTFESLSDFYDRAAKEPARSWLIPDLVPDRGRMLVVAAPSTGKTWLALIAAKSAIAQGRPVFLVEEEGSAKGLASRLTALGFEPSPLFNVAHLQGLQLTKPDHLKVLVEALRGVAAPVLILDPLTSLWTGDENSTQEANALRALFDALATANPAALLMVLHHTSKASANGQGHEIHAGRGSSVFGGWADFQVNLDAVATPKGAGRVDLKAKVAKDREGERGYRAHVRIELGAQEPVTISDATEAAGTDLKARIMAAAEGAPEPLTKNGLAADVSGNRQHKLEAIDALVREGRLTVVEGGRYRIATNAGGTQ